MTTKTIFELAEPFRQNYASPDKKMRKQLNKEIGRRQAKKFLKDANKDARAYQQYIDAETKNVNTN